MIPLLNYQIYHVFSQPSPKPAGHFDIRSSNLYMVRRRKKAGWARHPPALLMAVHRLRSPHVAENIPKKKFQNLPCINSLHYR